jgi:hypothetical protein
MPALPAAAIVLFVMSWTLTIVRARRAMTWNSGIVKPIDSHTADAALISRSGQDNVTTKPETPRLSPFTLIGRRIALAIGLAAGLCAISHAALAAQDCRTEVPAAQLSGSGEYRFLGLHLYDAQLWSTRLPVNYDTRFALQLTYATSATRERLTTLGLNEMKRLAPKPLPESLITRWRDDMLRAFVDVEPGDWLCGVFLPGTGVRFFANGAPTATIEDPDFARAFFDIWFDPGTRAKTLRAKLLGGS